MRLVLRPILTLNSPLETLLEPVIDMSIFDSL
nr:MAG TPA: hypothetical protein [Caudoviricetes sp.]